MRIELKGRDYQTLHTTDIPDFPEAPGVVLWGTRIFGYTATADAYPRVDGQPTHIYQEAEPYALSSESRSNA
jgi:hypothetical protein